LRPPSKYMTKMEQKVLDYLDSHKRPVTQNQLAKYFIVSSSSISNALGELEAAGLVVVTKQGNTKLYRIKADAGNA
jgi:uncharacterized membrane protein